MSDRDTDDDWVDKLTKLASSVGFNPVRVRWKLTRLRQSWVRQERVAEQKVQHVRYEHKVCPRCGRVNDRYAVKCVGCGEPMSSRTWQVFERAGVTMPQLFSVSSLLGVAMLGIYGYLMATNPRQGFSGWSAQVLIGHGANWSVATFHGQWWRLGTYLFLHIGIMHIAFNLIALAQIGPAIERVFGRGRMLFFFMLTGVVAGVASAALGHGMSAGASGAVMGLIGVGAGWGHRDGTSVGQAVRNMMLKWGLYTMVFGLIATGTGAVNVDNWAHGGGFVLGALLGYFTPSMAQRATAISPVSVVLGLVGAATATASVFLVVVPPKSTSIWTDALTPAGERALGYMVIDRACELRSAGQADKAAKQLAQMKAFGLTLSGDSAGDPVEQACAHATALRAMCAQEPPSPERLVRVPQDGEEYEDLSDDQGDRELACAAIRMADGWRAKGYY